MSQPRIPDGHQSVMPYLIVNNAAGLKAFLEEAFDAEESYQRMRDDNDRLIMHAEVTINGSTIMFADSTPAFTPQPAGLFIYVENTDKTYRKALAAGATSIMEPSDQDYGRFAGVNDPFGNTWWINSVP